MRESSPTIPAGQAGYHNLNLKPTLTKMPSFNFLLIIKILLLSDIQSKIEAIMTNFEEGGPGQIVKGNWRPQQCPLIEEKSVHWPKSDSVILDYPIASLCQK